MICEACGANAVDDNDVCITCGHLEGDEDCGCPLCEDAAFDDRDDDDFDDDFEIGGEG